MEECAILVVLKGVIDFLIPDHAAIRRLDALSAGRSIRIRRRSTYRYVHQLQPEGIADEVVRQDSGTLKTSVCPSRSIGICDVQLCDSDSLDLIRGLGHRPLHRLLVILIENRGHLQTSLPY